MFLKCFNQIRFYNILKTRCMRWYFKWMYIDSTCTAKNKKKIDSLTQSFRPHYGPGFDLTSNRNKYQEYFLGSKGGRCVGMTTLPSSCAVCREIWESQPLGTLRACTRIALSFSILIEEMFHLPLEKNVYLTNYTSRTQAYDLRVM